MTIEERLAAIEVKLEALTGSKFELTVNVEGKPGDEQIRALAMEGARKAVAAYIMGNHECGEEKYIGSGKIDIAAAERIVQQTMERLFPAMLSDYMERRG